MHTLHIHGFTSCLWLGPIPSFCKSTQSQSASSLSPQRMIATYCYPSIPHMSIPMLYLDEWVRSKGAISPTSKTHNPFTSTHQIEGHNMYHYFAAKPDRLQSIQSALANLYFVARPVGIFDWEGQLRPKEVSHQAHNVATIVDLSGGVGRTLQEIRDACPGLKGRFVLQDEKVVLDSIPQAA